MTEQPSPDALRRAREMMDQVIARGGWNDCTAEDIARVITEAVATAGKPLVQAAKVYHDAVNREIRARIDVMSPVHHTHPDYRPQHERIGLMRDAIIEHHKAMQALYAAMREIDPSIPSLPERETTPGDCDCPPGIEVMCFDKPDCPRRRAL